MTCLCEAYAVKVGTAIELDGRMCEHVQAADWLEGVPGYEGCFAFPTVAGPIAVRVAVTGRTVQWDGGACKVRVRVEFLDDDAPSTFVGGFAWVHSLEVA